MIYKKTHGKWERRHLKLLPQWFCSLQIVKGSHITETLLKQTRSSYIRLRMSAQSSRAVH